jgi:hypothetical protein
LVGLDLDQGDSTIHTGDKRLVTALGHYADGSTSAISNFHGFTWAVSDEKTLQMTVMDSGAAEILARSPGVASLTATDQGFSARVTFTVVHNLARVEISPNNWTMPPQFSVGLKAVAYWDDGKNQDVTTDCAWSLGDTSIGTMQMGTESYHLDDGLAGPQPFTDTTAIGPGSTLFLSAIAPGTETISATYQGVTGTTTLTIPPIEKAAEASLLLSSPLNQVGLDLWAGVDGNGVRTAVWMRFQGDIYAATHDATRWTDPVQLLAGTLYPPQRGAARLRVNEAGARLFLFFDDNGLHAAYAKPGEQFGSFADVPRPSPGRLDDVFGSVVLQADGSAVVGWSTYPVGAYISQFDPTSQTWSAPLLIAPQVYQLANNAAGDAVLSWAAMDTTTSICSLWSSIYLHDAGMQPAELLSTRTGTCVGGGESFAIDDQRNAIVTWTWPDARQPPPPSPANLPVVAQIAQWSPTAGWFENRVLPTPKKSYGAGNIQVLQDENGGAMVVWTDAVNLDLYASRYTPATGWTMADQVNVSSLNSVTIEGFAMTPNGNAICFYDEPFTYRPFVVGQGWEPPVVLKESGLVGDPNTTLRAGYNREGKGLILWQEFGAGITPGVVYNTDYLFLALAPDIP